MPLTRLFNFYATIRIHRTRNNSRYKLLNNLCNGLKEGVKSEINSQLKTKTMKTSETKTKVSISLKNKERLYLYIIFGIALLMAIVGDGLDRGDFVQLISALMIAAGVLILGVLRFVTAKELLEKEEEIFSFKVTKLDKDETNP